ncbi:hypothetical protein D3C76_1424470 [compost metagenome]
MAPLFLLVLLQQVAQRLIAFIEAEDGFTMTTQLIDVRFTHRGQIFTQVRDEYLLVVNVAIVVSPWVAPSRFDWWVVMSDTR